MKKVFVFAVLFVLMIAAAAVCAAPEISDQINLIAANANLWKQNIDFGLWGFAVTDLDHNGRLEILAASVQGTGFYTYINAYEVNEKGDGFNELQGPSILRTDSAPDIMVSNVPCYFDKDAGRYYYIFDDYIRNGIAENYQNRCAVSIADGKWEETTLASKATIYTDADHYTMTCTDASGNTITEEEYDEIAQTVYGKLKAGEICLNWQMTEKGDFEALSSAQLIEKLNTAADGTCKAN